MRLSRPLLSTLGILACQAVASADRGVWFWASTTLPSGAASSHGSDDIVGVSDALEDAAVTFLTGCGVTRLYGSYKNRPFSEPHLIRPWNAKLAAAGIESQLLLELADEDDLTDPDHLDLADKVTKRLVLFNDAATPAEQFQALHLDLEPQALAAWDSGTAAARRVMLDQLLDAYLDLRALLDGAGYAWVPIYADIPPTWDKMPLPDPEDGKVGWADSADRDAWFAAVAGVLEGVSLMTFNKDSFAGIDDITAYERAPANFPAEARVAIQPKIGPSELWLTYAEFLTVLTAMETAWGKADLENYAFWRAFKPTLTTSGLLDADIEVAADGPHIVFAAKPDHLYTVRSADHLAGQWREVATLPNRDASPRLIRHRISTDARRTFWKVEEEPLAQ